jgi:hypothetical protein
MISRPFKIMLLVLLTAVAVMGFYTYRLQRSAEAHVQKASAPVPVQPVGEESRITLVLASDATGSLQPSAVSAKLPTEKTERARAILQLLLQSYQQPESPHPFGNTGDIDAVFFLDNGLAVVDLSDSLAKTHPSGIMLESLTLESIGRTLHANFPEINTVHFIVAGKPQETLAGHADLMTDYPVAESAE